MQGNRQRHLDSSALTYHFLYSSILIFLRIDNAEVWFRHIPQGMNLLLTVVLLAFAVSEDYSACSKQNKEGRRSSIEILDIIQVKYVRFHESLLVLVIEEFTEFLLRSLLISHLFPFHSLFIPMFSSNFHSFPFLLF